MTWFIFHPWARQRSPAVGKGWQRWRMRLGKDADAVRRPISGCLHTTHRILMEPCLYTAACGTPRHTWGCAGPLSAKCDSVFVEHTCPLSVYMTLGQE
jgi:hypothetical protein